MSTNNFAYENVLYVLEIDENDDLLFDDTTDNIYYEIEKAFKDIPQVIVTQENKESPYSLFSYYRKIFTEISLPVDGEYITIALTRSSGYYADANFDFDITINDHDENYPEDDTYTLKELENHRILREEYDFLELAIPLIEKVYGEWLTKVNHIGTFSNGEALYEKAI